MQRFHALADTLLALESTLREAGYWQADPPTPAAMASRAPFAADTLTPAQWLQFVFIPRMRIIIAQGADLPSACAIAPYIQHALAESPAKPTVVDRLRVLDALIVADQPPNTAGT